MRHPLRQGFGGQAAHGAEAVSAHAGNARSRAHLRSAKEPNVTTTCGQCGEPINGESPDLDPAQRERCRKCGSTTRTSALHAQATSSSSATANPTVITYPQKLLTVARGLIDQGEHSIAVVVAHIACEVATERSLSESFVTRGIQYLEDPVTEFLNGYNLANERIRKLYTALTGDQVQNTVFWPKFKESATRRNKIIHEGALAASAEAEESYRAASDLVAHLNK
jgi:hypothetical protein